MSGCAGQYTSAARGEDRIIAPRSPTSDDEILRIRLKGICRTSSNREMGACEAGA